MRRSVAAVAASFVGLAACGDGVPTDAPEDSLVAVTLATVRGDSQTGEVGRLLEEFLVFRVTDPDGQPVDGLRVEWEVMAGGGKVSGKRHETDTAGLAAGNFTLGPEPGEHVARAVVHDSLAIEFTAFANPVSPGELPAENSSPARARD
jgi:hypothetical protein